MSAPLYKRDDIVYLRSSAEIGKLDSFRISNSISNNINAGWFYKILIHKKPPGNTTHGDQVDHRMVEKSILYSEAELITLCEAIGIIITRLETQLARVENTITILTDDDDVVIGAFDSKFNIGDEVWVAASARVGFFENHKIKEIQDVGVQHGSKKPKFQYRLTNLPNNIFFRGDELLNKHDAALLIRNSIQDDLNRMITVRDQNCQ